MRRLAGALLIVLLVAAQTPAADHRPFDDGIQAYLDGAFDRAAVDLKRTLFRPANAQTPAAAYFAGRSFEELGLRGLALHYFGRAEGDDRWRLPALREIIRAYFQMGEHRAVLDVFGRLRPGDSDAEILYLAGISAATGGRWKDSIATLRRVPRRDPLHGYALYVSAQAHAASGDTAAALAELRAVEGFGDGVPAELRDQARILRGKILYLEGRESESRAAFGGVASAGSLGFESLRGLLLTHASAEVASRATVSPSRPEDAATLLVVKAVAAEERDDPAEAIALREKLRRLVRDRMRALDQLGRSPTTGGVVEAELGRFASRLRGVRWRERWAGERRLLEAAGASSSSEPEAGEPFKPSDGLFYAAWNRARVDAKLRNAIEILSRTQQLRDSLEQSPGGRPFWMFWRGDEDRRLAVSLLALRAANLEQLFADHLYTLERVDAATMRSRKRSSVTRVAKALRGLYLGSEAKVPTSLSNLDKTLEYKESDMLRLVEAVPERSTDPGTSLLGNFIDLLEEMRTGLEEVDEPVPRFQDVSGPLLDDITARTSALRREVESMIRRTLGPTIRREVALFTRLEADNEGSLSRLYASGGATRRRPAPAKDSR